MQDVILSAAQPATVQRRQTLTFLIVSASDRFARSVCLRGTKQAKRQRACIGKRRPTNHREHRFTAFIDAAEQQRMI